MRYIRLHPETLEITVGFKPGVPGLTIPMAAGRPRGGVRTDHPVADAVLFDVLYPAVQERDQRLGRTRRKYALVPPDPWLVALGLVMWEGIVQGLSWDVVKLTVRSALNQLRRARVAPPAHASHSVKRSFQLGFHWTAYTKGEKQREMFVGLRRKFEKTSKPRKNEANPALKATRRKRRAP